MTQHDLNVYRNNPVAFLRDIYGMEITRWQEEAILRIIKNERPPCIMSSSPARQTSPYFEKFIRRLSND